MRRKHEPKYVLRLYITGSRPLSLRAVANIRAICEQELKGRYRLEVVDMYQQPLLAQRENIVAAPTLVRRLPLPLRTLIGDLSERQRVLLGLELIQEP